MPRHVLSHSVGNLPHGISRHDVAVCRGPGHPYHWVDPHQDLTACSVAVVNVGSVVVVVVAVVADEVVAPSPLLVDRGPVSRRTQHAERILLAVRRSTKEYQDRALMASAVLLDAALQLETPCPWEMPRLAV